MYNIDFRVSGQLVSIPVCLNDSITTLINRMKQSSPFRKYTHSQLEDRLITYLSQIMQREPIDSKMGNRIKDLLRNSGSSRSQEKRIEFSQQKSRNLSNNTFVNILQQNSMNTSYLAQNNRSQTRLNRKYGNMGSNYEDNSEDFVQNHLKYNYQARNKQVNNTIKQNYPIKTRQLLKHGHQDQTKININNYLNKKKTSSNYSQLQSQFQRSINREVRDDLSKVRENNVSKYFNEIKQVSKPLSRQKASIKNTTIDSRAGTHATSRYPFENQFNYVRNYDPVSKLNQLIERSKSLSQIVPKTHQYQLNNYETDLNHHSSENKPNAGKIQHRKNPIISLNSRQNYSTTNQHHIHTRSITSNYRQSEIKNRQQSSKRKQLGQILKQNSLNLRQKNQTIDQKQRNHYQNKRVYSYL